MPNEKLIELLNQQWCDANQFQQIAGCGRNKSYEIIKSIRDKLEQDGYWLPKNKVPMKNVVEFLKIDIAYLQRMEKLNEVQR